jgi:hypothetical protein
MMVREEKLKTIYTTFDLSKRILIVPDSDFRKNNDQSNPMYSNANIIDFKDTIIFIAVMDDSKYLCIGFE